MNERSLRLIRAWPLLDDRLSDVQPSDLQLIGKIAVLSDPQGAAFAIFEGETDE